MARFVNVKTKMIMISTSKRIAVPSAEPFVGVIVSVTEFVARDALRIHLLWMFSHDRNERIY